jgi:hypothetical protein
MGQLADRFNNSAASLVAMCNQSPNSASLMAALLELQTAAEILDDQLGAQIDALRGPNAPVNILLPSISGIAQLGQTLSATTGTWGNSPPTTFTYQWQSGGVNATGAGATTANYTPVQADVGQPLTVIVRAMNIFGVGTATSAPTSSVIDIIPTINTIASIPGTPQVGLLITAIDAIWNHSVTSLAYQWKAGGVNATGPGATTLTYMPVIGDLGLTLTITVTATNSGGTSIPSTSAPSAPVIGPTGGLGIGVGVDVGDIPIGA